MKLFVFVLSSYIGGGTEKVFENTAQAIHKKTAYSKIFLYVVNGIDIQKYSVPDYVSIVHTKSELKTLSKTKEKIVVNFSGDWKSGLFSRILSKKYISWIHQNPLTMKTARTAFLNFSLLKKSRKIVCVCNEQKDILQKKFHFRNEISVIYNSIDIEKIKELAASSFAFSDGNYILMVARIDFASKDFFTVVDAYSLLADDFQKKYRLVFLGDGPDKKDVEEYVKKKNLEERVVFAGFDKNPYKWMKNAALYILSSKTEGVNVSVVEAMFLGVPGILTDYKTGSFEISDNGRNAVVVPVGDSRKMADAICRVLLDKDFRNSLVQNARQFVERFYQSKFEKSVERLFMEFENGL